MATEDDPRSRRYARIAPLYKALIWTSFAINAVLIILVAVLGWTVFSERRQILSLRSTAQQFAGYNVSELQDVVSKLQGATIKYVVPLDTQLPINLQVPVNTTTVVTLTQDIPLSVPAAILFPGGGGNLNTQVNIRLPEGLQLPISLNFVLPLNQEIPVHLNVPVNIPLAQTELGPQFQRLGAVVERLVAPAAPLLTFPDVPPDSSKLQSVPVPAQTLGPEMTPAVPLQGTPTVGTDSPAPVPEQTAVPGAAGP